VPKVRTSWSSGASGELVSGIVVDESEGLTHMTQAQDIAPILEENKRLYNDEDGGWSPSKEWRRAASVPITVYADWAKKLGVSPADALSDPGFLQKVLAMLDDPENRAFRTAPGRLSRRPVKHAQVGYRGGSR
jgi:hypothetical protein